MRAVFSGTLVAGYNSGNLLIGGFIMAPKGKLGIDDSAELAREEELPARSRFAPGGGVAAR